MSGWAALMQSLKQQEPRCVAIVSSVSLEDVDCVETLPVGAALGGGGGGGGGGGVRWLRRGGSLSCNGDLCPVVISSPYCKRSNTTAALCSVVAQQQDYDINENPNSIPSHHQHSYQHGGAVAPSSAAGGVISSTIHIRPLTETLATSKNPETLRVRPPSAPPSYSSLISLAGLDCIDYPDYHFDNLEHPGSTPDVDFVERISLECAAPGPAAGGTSAAELEYPGGTKARTSAGGGGHPRHPRDTPSIMGSPSLRATARMMRKHYR